MRTSGVLLPVFSLPSPHGIGCFSKEAYEWVDFLKLAGQQYWQILPLGPTSYGDSPYQSFSTYAGNPYFIDLEELVEAGFLTRKEVEACDCGKAARDIDYGKLYENRMPLLKLAYERSLEKPDPKFTAFWTENAWWLDDYGLFMAVKDIFITGGVVSGLGKGITAASLGRLLKQRGLKVTLQKFDPYLNVDPGTMSPYQHGEVFVTDDGAETDLDLGHYERFTDENLTVNSSVTSGKVYWSVLNRERNGTARNDFRAAVYHIFEIGRLRGVAERIEPFGGFAVEMRGRLLTLAPCHAHCQVVAREKPAVARDDIPFVKHDDIAAYHARGGNQEGFPLPQNRDRRCAEKGKIRLEASDCVQQPPEEQSAPYAEQEQERQTAQKFVKAQ